MLVYRASEECSQSGVMVDNYLYPGYSGYFDDPLIHIAFFALAYDQGPGTQLYLSAIDLAGNQGRTGFVHHINKRVFKKDLVNISDNFLNMTIPKFEQEIDGPDLSPEEKFIQINNEMREENANRIYEVTRQSDLNLYWKNSFLRLPGSANRAAFGEYRSYYYKNNLIDQQTHLGVDLASNANSPVPVANAGKVVFAEKLGIYGLTVIVDHGFGLFSLYAHLSQFRVSVGQVLKKGQFIGDTGSSGLALGDHLHFSMLVHKTFVNPIEWWDAKWIENNISTKLSRE
jgi:murein DD-endopeptidase MepM/ murein hydrolase activator NlpD